MRFSSAGSIRRPIKLLALRDRALEASVNALADHAAFKLGEKSRNGLGSIQVRCSVSAALSTGAGTATSIDPHNPHNCCSLPARYANYWRYNSNRRERGRFASARTRITKELGPRCVTTPGPLLSVQGTTVLVALSFLAAEKLSQSGRCQSNDRLCVCVDNFSAAAPKTAALLGIQEIDAMENKTISASEMGTCLNKAGRPTSESSVRRWCSQGFGIQRGNSR